MANTAQTSIEAQLRETLHPLMGVPPPPEKRAEVAEQVQKTAVEFFNKLTDKTGVTATPTEVNVLFHGDEVELILSDRLIRVVEGRAQKSGTKRVVTARSAQ